MKNNETILALKEALQLTPDNARLRGVLAEMLLENEMPEEAETEFRLLLSQTPDSFAGKYGLARAYFAQGKDKLAVVLFEDVLREPDAPALAHVFCAKALMRAGNPGGAVEQYKAGVAKDPGVADETFAAHLGIDADETREDVVDGRVRASVDEIFGGDASAFERPNAGFDAVGGMDNVKEEIRLKIILPLTNQALYAAYGKKTGGGILMYGPPGCGKTLIARATAGEAKTGFISIGLHDVLDMWIGQSEQKLHALFEQARYAKPCILFVDEVDALGASRSDMRHSAGRHLINQFLSELDGVNANNDGLLVLAATNAPWHLDSAFRRPGRFDRIIFVPPPDVEARAAILRIKLEGKPCEAVDFETVARKIEGFSGADITGLVDVAIEMKLKEALKKGTPSPIATKDLLSAAKQTKPSTRDWFSTARNHALFANESGIYDEILTYLNIKK